MEAVGELENRRQASLGELQSLAVELAVAVASKLVHDGQQFLYFIGAALKATSVGELIENFRAKVVFGIGHLLKARLHSAGPPRAVPR